MQSCDIIEDSQQILSLVTAQSRIMRFRESPSSLNPTDDHFDFSLWARAVRKQMVESLQRRNKSNIGTKP